MSVPPPQKLILKGVLLIINLLPPINQLLSGFNHLFCGHLHRFLAVDFCLPTGDHEELSDPGEDMYTTMFTLGGTYYPDKAKTWSFSLLARYEVHSEKRNTESRPGGWDTDLNPGDDFHFEWGIGKTLAKVWDVGLVGYAQFQVQHDHGTGADTHLEQAFGIGPEVSVFCTPLKAFFSLRSLWEFGVEGRSTGRPEGNRTFFVITKIL